MARPVTRWRLERRGPLGRNPVFVDTTARVSDLGPFSVGGDGNCLDGLLEGLAGVLPFGPRDLVTLETSEDGIAWIPRYAGVVVADAADRSPDVGAFRLEGLERRVREAEVTAFSYGAGDAASIARQATLAVVAGGQLGDAVVFDGTLMPDTGVTVPEVRPDYATLGELLDRLAAAVPGCTWGVDARRRGFFRVPSGTLELGGTDWLPVDASGVVSAVRWVLRASDLPRYSSSGGVRSIAGGGELDSRLLTHLSEDSALVTSFGTVVRTVPVPPEVAWLRPLDVASFTVVAGSLVSGTAALLGDGDPATGVIVTPTGGPSLYTAAVEIDFLGSGSVPIAGVTVSVSGSGVQSVGVQQESAGPGSTLSDLVESASLTGTIRGLAGTFVALDYQQAFHGAWTGRLRVTITTTASASVTVGELHPVVVDTTLLDSLARLHLSAPVLEAAVALVPGLLEPGASASVTQRLPDGTLEATTLTVASLEYRLSGPNAGTTVRLGQRQDARATALAARQDAALDAAALRAVRFAAAQRR